MCGARCDLPQDHGGPCLDGCGTPPSPGCPGAEGPQKSADDDRAKLTIHKQLADDVTKRMIPPYGWVSMVVEDGNDYSPKSEQLEDAEALQTPRECSRETVECAEEPAQDGDSPRSTHVASCECQFCCPYLHDRLPRKYEAV